MNLFYLIDGLIFVYIVKKRKQMSVKIDLKTGIILLLLVFCVLFFSMWYLKSDGIQSKKEIKRLELEFNKIQKTRDSLNLVNTELKGDFAKLQKKIDLTEKSIKLLEYQLDLSQREVQSSKLEVIDMKRDLEKTKKKIEELKKNPIKREDENLIESLKQKLN